MNIEKIEDLTLKLVAITEAAALASSDWLGSGDEKAADQAAVDAMRCGLNALNISGTVVIGEGERDSAPMLHIGEKVGKGGVSVDIALDPLEGTSICANHKDGAMSVLAITEAGGFLHAPDVYMDKIVVGDGLPNEVVSLRSDIELNLHNLVQAKGCDIRDLKVIVLSRARHEELIARIRKCGARVKLIEDGDISAVLSVVYGEYDMYVGSGGAPEGVLAASVVCSLGGQMEGRLVLDDDQLRKRAKKIGIVDPNKIYKETDMVKSPSIFVASGVTDGTLLAGVQCSDNSRYNISSIVILPGSVMHITRSLGV